MIVQYISVLQCPVRWFAREWSLSQSYVKREGGRVERQGSCKETCFGGEKKLEIETGKGGGWGGGDEAETCMGGLQRSWV